MNLGHSRNHDKVDSKCRMEVRFPETSAGASFTAERAELEEGSTLRCRLDAIFMGMTILSLPFSCTVLHCSFQQALLLRTA